MAKFFQENARQKTLIACQNRCGMPTLRLTRASIADLDRLPFAGLLSGIVMLGLALRVFLVTNTTTWSVELERILTLVPVIVGVFAYVRNRPAAGAWEIGVVAIWGFIVQWVMSLVWFIVGPTLADQVSVSAIILSGAAELRLAELLRYLSRVTVFAALYTVAASRRDRPVVTVLTLLSVPILMILIYGII